MILEYGYVYIKRILNSNIIANIKYVPYKCNALLKH